MSQELQFLYRVQPTWPGGCWSEGPTPLEMDAVSRTPPEPVTSPAATSCFAAAR